MYEPVPDGGVTIIMPTRRNKLPTYGEDEDDDLDSGGDDDNPCERFDSNTPPTNKCSTLLNNTDFTNYKRNNEQPEQEVPHHDNAHNERWTPLRRLPSSPSTTSPSPNSIGDSPASAAGAAGAADVRNEATLVHIAERDRQHHRHNNFNNINVTTNTNQQQDNYNGNCIANIATNNTNKMDINSDEHSNRNNINCISNKVPVMAMDEYKEAHEQKELQQDDRSKSDESNECWNDLNINGLHERGGWNDKNDRINWNERHDREENYCVGIGDRVDIEQIKLERYKNKTKSIGVQTMHLSPYRLRFWPVAASIKCLDASFMDVVKCCLRTLSQWFLSQVGLTCVLIVWALLGATAFYKTEGPREYEQAEQINHHKNDIAIDLATDLRQLKEGSDAWPATIQKYLNKHETLLLQAVSSGYVEGGGAIWTYPGCVLFAVLLLTTLGFGAPVPRTSLGRGMAVLFSAIGIPLHFMLIINVSTLIAKRLQNLATIKPNGDVQETKTRRRLWYKWFPPFVVVSYYILGVICFGVLRKRSVVECLMFALDFTESGGVANTAGHVRIFYALYIELAVIIAATIMSMIQVSATTGVIDLGLRLGLLTNT